VFGGWTATTSLNLSYQSGYDFYADGGGPLGFDRQNATALVNGSLRFTSPNGTLFAQLWVKNLTNKEYYLDAETDTFAAHYIAALPRTFGGTVGLQF
jgi:outer membrane receptor protein involved in Fe transport